MKEIQSIDINQKEGPQPSLIHQLSSKGMNLKHCTSSLNAWCKLSTYILNVPRLLQSCRDDEFVESYD